jgi:acyl-CoA thioester hydrolase
VPIVPAGAASMRTRCQTGRVSTWSAPVRWSEVDRQGIVFNAHYLTYCDEAMGAFCEQHGLGSLGDELHVVAATLSWSAPLRHGDVVEVDVRCTAVGNTSLTVAFDIGVGGRACCVVQLTYVHTGGAGAPSPLPAQVRVALS